jgi:hypothetical protein
MPEPPPGQPPEQPAIAAALARLDLGPGTPAPLQRAAVAALAWLGGLDREVGPTPPR